LFSDVPQIGTPIRRDSIASAQEAARLYVKRIELQASNAALKRRRHVRKANRKPKGRAATKDPLCVADCENDRCENDV
jgi:hypothetical protein